MTVTQRYSLSIQLATHKRDCSITALHKLPPQLLQMIPQRNENCQVGNYNINFYGSSQHCSIS